MNVKGGIMKNKRYSIVSVDMRCPYGLEETFCSNDCHSCRLGYGYYGDTKEQLIHKIAQVMKQPNGLIIGRDKQHSHSAEYLAKEIVEFLGVDK
jgi:hypothetical protein